MSPAVKPIPDGYHSLNPHLVIQGAAKAIDFYKKAFGAEEVMRMPSPDGKSIMHAELKIGDSRLMLTDEAPHCGNFSPAALKGSPVTIHHYVKDVDAVFKRALDAGAKVKMPVQDMFWGDRYGKLTDPFGHDWSLATHKEDVPPQQMGMRAQEAFSQMGKN